MTYEEAVKSLNSSIKFQADLYKNLFAAGLSQEQAHELAQATIGDLFDSDIPRPELIEAYKMLDQ